jgi:tetratricopeptide (TPR) repeat protein
MERVEKTVFLSYRRTNFAWALNIFQNLTQHGYDVFVDFNGIASGDFESVILGNITARAHFLVLLTPSALEHCDDPADWLRREIETALASQRNIVPLMMEGFDFGTPKIANQLTGKLAALKKYNGLHIPPEYFLEAMGRLRERYLNVKLTAVLHPASPLAQKAATEQKAAADAAPLVREEALTAQQWFERGVAATDLDEKLRFYSEAIRLKPDYADAYNSRGLVRRARGDGEGAHQDDSEAVRLRPAFAYIEAIERLDALLVTIAGWPGGGASSSVDLGRVLERLGEASRIPLWSWPIKDSDDRRSRSVLVRHVFEVYAALVPYLPAEYIETAVRFCIECCTERTGQVQREAALLLLPRLLRHCSDSRLLDTYARLFRATRGGNDWGSGGSSDCGNLWFVYNSRCKRDHLSRCISDLAACFRSSDRE